MSTVDYTFTSEAAQETADEAVRPTDLESVRPLPRISVHAFCESEAMLCAMERCGQDRRMAKVSLKISSASIAAAANMFASAPTPNLLILETSTEPRGIMEELDLRRPIYTKTAAFGHFGRTEPEFTWERTDKAEALKKAIH